MIKILEINKQNYYSTTARNTTAFIVISSRTACSIKTLTLFLILTFLCAANELLKCCRHQTTSNLQHVIKVRNAFNYTVPVTQKHSGTWPTSEAPITTVQSTCLATMETVWSQVTIQAWPSMSPRCRLEHTHTTHNTHNTHNREKVNSVSHEQWNLKLAANSKHQLTSALGSVKSPWWSMTSDIPLHSTTNTETKYKHVRCDWEDCRPAKYLHIQDVPRDY